MAFPPGPNVTKHFMAVIYNVCYKIRVFVPGKPFPLSLMISSKAGAYPNGEPFRDSPLRVDYLACHKQ